MKSSLRERIVYHSYIEVWMWGKDLVPSIMYDQIDEPKDSMTTMMVDVQ